VRPLRIAFGRVAQETNSLSPVLTEVADFRRTHWFEGADLLERCASRFRREAPGFARNAELSGFVQRAQRLGVELVPLISAWAVPGGPLSAGALADLQDRLAEALAAAGPVDGVYLAMHGAMGAEGDRDPEATLLRALKRVADVPIAVSFDLHAHLTPEKVELARIVVGYQTNPHRDHARCGRRAADLLVRTLRDEIRPTSAYRILPMVLGGGTTLDFLEPMRSIYRRIAAMERSPGVLHAATFQCQLWNDSPRAGWAVKVITDGDAALAERLADELAERSWSVRDHLPPELPDPSEAIRRARAATWRRKLGVVCISDASDMVGAGAIGENTGVLEALLREGQGLRSYVPIRDAEVVAQLWDTPLGEGVTVDVGGKLAPELHAPVRVTGVLRARRETEAFGRALLLDLDHVQLVVTSAAPLAMKPSFFTDWGLSLRQADVVVVKSLFPFRLYFLAWNRLTIYAKTRGTTDFDAWKRITYARPVHPKDPVADWR
jgi:microcystin degradation protein MlrC